MEYQWDKATFPVAGTRGLLRQPEGTLLVAHARRDTRGAVVVCAASRDAGNTWRDGPTIALDTNPETDIGDGMLLRTRSGTLLYCYRQNHHGASVKQPDYAIRIAVSRDGGKSWEPHSTVTAHMVMGEGGPSQGLWAPFLFETPSGRLQCYYDDEKTPHDAGFRGHQWLMMQTWNVAGRYWEKPVVVSRANDPAHLSRDGMGTVVSVGGRSLVCVLESVQTAPPHAAVVRLVRSDDEGTTWSWQKQERAILYQPSKEGFMSLSPQVTRLAEGTLACIFCTDEDRDVADRAGTPPHRLNMDIKLVLSQDQGKTWSRPQVVADSHRCYLPGLVDLSRGKLLATWLDFTAGHLLGRWATATR